MRHVHVKSEYRLLSLSADDRPKIWWCVCVCVCVVGVWGGHCPNSLRVLLTNIPVVDDFIYGSEYLFDYRPQRKKQTSAILCVCVFVGVCVGGGGVKYG